MGNNATVYLVGDKNSLKANSYLAMTNSLEEAERLVKELPEAVTIKKVEVKNARS